MVRFLLSVIPMFVPQIASASGAPAIFHTDFTPVTAAKPAKPGEILIVKATGLGPTLPGVNPGQPFPEVLQPVNSPVSISVNGQPAQVVNAVGWPGRGRHVSRRFSASDGGASGTASVQLTAAWIGRPPVSIAVQ
jgi:hypothetical protein